MKYLCWFKDNPNAKREIDTSWIDMAAELFCYEEDERDTGLMEEQALTVVVQAPNGAEWELAMRGKWTLNYHVENVIRLGVDE